MFKSNGLEDSKVLPTEISNAPEHKCGCATNGKCNCADGAKCSCKTEKISQLKPFSTRTQTADKELAE